jgi:hypothetical protein
MPVEVNLSTRPGTTVEERELAVPVGVLVRGRAIDERTGKPVEGNLSYFAYETNPELQKSPELRDRGRWWRDQGVQTDAEGRFAIAVFSGPGILAFRAGPRFRFGVGAEQINCPTYGDGLENSRSGKLFRTLPRPCQSQAFNLLVPVDPRPEAEDMAVDFKLRSGVDVIARVRTSDGQPLGTYYELGAMSQNSWMEQNEDRFTIVGCYPEETRRVFLYQPARNLVAYADVTGVPPEPIEIRLRPGASVIGRLLDENGEPVEDATFFSEMMPMRAAVGHLAEMKRDRGMLPNVAPFLKTDEQGRFAIKGLIPGLKYSARSVVTRHLENGSVQRVASIFSDITTKSRETKNLGDVRLQPPEVPRMRMRRGIQQQ